MKNTKLRIKKKVRISGIKRLKQDIDGLVYDALMDIKWYLVKDITDYLKKKGIIYYAKNKKKNRKAKKRKP